MRHKRIYLISKAVDGLWRRPGHMIWGKRDDFGSPGFAVGLGPEGRKLNVIRI